MSEKEKYKQLICSTPLFSLDKELEYSVYKDESAKLLKLLAEYLYAENEEYYRNYGLEIVDTANNCVKSFKGETKDFLKYYLSSLKKACRISDAEQAVQDIRRGIHISEEDDELIRATLKYMESKSITELTDRDFAEAAMFLEISVEKVKKVARAINETSVISDLVYNEDGELNSLFDTITIDGEIDKKIIDDESQKELLSKIEAVYLSCQDRQKPLLSVLLTSKLCKIICEYSISDELHSFINKEIIIQYIRHGTVPTQREIAERFGKKESDISRTFKNFGEKLKSVLQ